MDERAAHLIERLGLVPHPEGGAFREIHRAAGCVAPDDGRPPRSAITAIYFLLSRGEASRWHRVRSDEVWIWLEGAPLALYLADAPGSAAVCETLGPVGPAARPIAVVPAGRWQAARSQGDYTLVACTVGPGFDFADFELDAAAPLPDAAAP